MQFPHHYKTPLQKCEIRIDDSIFDVTSWRHKHPGGAELLDKFHNSDATDIFYAFHSKDAVAMLKHIKHGPNNNDRIPREELAQKFDDFRRTLLRDRWMERNWFADFLVIMLPCVTLAVLGTMLSWSHPLAATVLLGVGMQQAGWIGHDYMHGRGKISKVLGIVFGACYNGFSPSWWNHKHNTHHAFPNRREFDADIHNEPILHLWFPDASRDVWFRKYQHFYYMFVYAWLYVSWRMQSIQFVLGSKNWFERGLIVMNYAWLACLPWYVSVGSILVGGWLVAIVVTANHQSEEILEPTSKYNFCVDQFTTTRGVVCSNWFLEYIFGGMQYQLEHHMFPHMPKYRYPQLRRVLEKFAKENNLPYKLSSVSEIMAMNFNCMKKFATAKMA